MMKYILRISLNHISRKYFKQADLGIEDGSTSRRNLGTFASVGVLGGGAPWQSSDRAQQI